MDVCAEPRPKHNWRPKQNATPGPGFRSYCCCCCCMFLSIWLRYTAALFCCCRNTGMGGKERGQAARAKGSRREWGAGRRDSRGGELTACPAHLRLLRLRQLLLLCLLLLPVLLQDPHQQLVLPHRGGAGGLRL